MKIAVTGSNGLIGSALVPLLKAKDHTVLRVVRGQGEDSDISWDPQSGKIDANKFIGVDALVHLAGENIASSRWSEEKKQAISNSRVTATNLLCQSLAKLEKPPKVLIAASAIGFYGDRGNEVLNEESASGSNFLANVCSKWEDATKVASASGMRVVNLRIGVVLSPKGGALSRMLLPFQLGLGGPIGNGKQYMSWIAIDDVVGAIYQALVSENLSGSVNATAPKPSTNFEYTKALGKVLSRPTIAPMPDFVARLAFGQMADELLLASACVHPDKLLASGFNFQYPEIEAALRHVLQPG